ncbi:MAG: 2Fe-2S iron-sulfur cluster-binding protein [Burkholderiaceae bacterium]
MADTDIDRDWLELVVLDAVRTGADTMLLRLGGGPAELPAYEPGAHVAVQCGGDMVRHYSLSGCGADRGVYELGVKLDPETRGGSRWIFEHARPASTLRVSAPRNHFPLVGDAPAYLFLSGGIGITPIIAMLHALRRSNRRARLVHLCRSREQLAFADWLDELAAFHDVHLHFDSEAGGVYDLQAELQRCPADTEIYCCGPAPMIAAVQELAGRDGRADRLHVEFFAPPAAPDGADRDDCEFVVVQHRTGRRIPVPATKTMLAALRDAGFEMKSQCEYGVCGWCMVGVVDGEPAHFDSYLTAAEKAANKLVLPCVSRCAGTTLTLDI